MTTIWSEEQGLRFELAVEVLSGEVGRRTQAIRQLPETDLRERARLERERTAIIRLSNLLSVDDQRRIEAILNRNIGEALQNDEPLARYAI